jgi:hypothetical protein
VALERNGPGLDAGSASEAASEWTCSRTVTGAAKTGLPMTMTGQGEHALGVGLAAVKQEDVMELDPVAGLDGAGVQCPTGQPGGCNIIGIM